MFQQYKNNLYYNNINNNNNNFIVHNLSINNINQSTSNISNKKKLSLKNSLSSLEIKNFNYFNNFNNNNNINNDIKNNNRNLSSIIQHTLYKNFKLNKTPSVSELTNPLRNLTKKIRFKKIIETDSLFNVHIKRNLKQNFLNNNLKKINNKNNNFNRSTSIEKNDTFDISYNINNSLNNNNNNNIKNSRNSSRIINNTSSLFLLPNITKSLSKSNSTLITTLDHKNNPLKKNYKLTFLINNLIYNDFKYNQNKSSIANNCIKYRKIKIFQYYQKERIKNLDKTKEKKDLFNNIKKLNNLRNKINKIFPDYFLDLKNYKNFLEQKKFFY